MSNRCVSIAVLTLENDVSRAKELIEKWAQPDDYAEAQSRDNTDVSRRFLLGRSLVRALLECKMQVLGRECRIATDENGKPTVDVSSEKPGLFISISHSGKVIAAAATMVGPVGIDIEFHRLNRPFDDLAAFAMGPYERQAARESPEAFYRIWCVREAMSKATGKGLREAIDRTDRAVLEPAQDFPEGVVCTDEWLLASLNPVRHYTLAIAIIRSKLSRNINWTKRSMDIWFPLKK